MEQYLLYILLLCVGIIIGGILYKYSMTTPEQRELEYKDSLKRQALLDKYHLKIDKLDKKFDEIKNKHNLTL